MKVNGPGRSKLGQKRNSWQWAKHAWLYSDLLQALKGEHFVSSGFSTAEGTLISVPAVRHCGLRVPNWTRLNVIVANYNYQHSPLACSLNMTALTNNVANSLAHAFI